MSNEEEDSDIEEEEEIYDEIEHDNDLYDLDIDNDYDQIFSVVFPRSNTTTITYRRNVDTTNFLNYALYNSFYNSLLNNVFEDVAERILDSVLDDVLNESFLEQPSMEKTDTLLSLPIEKFSNITTIEKQCCICMEDFKENDDISILNSCKHTFHNSCIVEWGKYKTSCPVCRNSL